MCIFVKKNSLLLRSSKTR